MEIQKNLELAPHTTFFIGGPAKFFCVAQTVEDIKQALIFAKQEEIPIFVLGGGSNVLVSDQGFEGLVVKPDLKGIDLVDEVTDLVVLQIGSGEVWDKVVELAVKNSWWGIENLSHIPGNMGAFAVQNVGAYGQEASQVVSQVEALDINTLEIKRFGNTLSGQKPITDCEFTYRHSIFNTSQKGNYIILSTSIILSKVPKPNLQYGDVREYFSTKAIGNPSQGQIRQAIIEIRNTKFPFPTEAVGGNAGSFFRGPIITKEQLDLVGQIIKKRFGD